MKKLEQLPEIAARQLGGLEATPGHAGQDQAEGGRRAFAPQACLEVDCRAGHGLCAAGGRRGIVAIPSQGNAFGRRRADAHPFRRAGSPGDGNSRSRRPALRQHHLRRRPEGKLRHALCQRGQRRIPHADRQRGHLSDADPTRTAFPTGFWALRWAR